VTGFVLGQNQASATTGTLTFLTSAASTSNVGVYAINGSGLTANNNNYVFVQAAGNAKALTITPATLTYAANDVSKTYGASNPALSGTVTGFVLGQTQASATTGTLGFATSATASSNVGAYAINGSGLTAKNGNYVFVQAVGNATALTINPATLTYTANDASKTYGASNPALSGTVTGFVLGQNQGTATTGTLGFATSATSSSNVGSYAVNGSGLTAKNGNYVFVQAAGNATALTINPATLTYDADIVIRPYGSDNPTLPGEVTGFVLGQTQASATTGTLVFTTTATKTSWLGFYPITGSGLSANNGNYVFVQAPWNGFSLIISPFNFNLVFNVAQGQIVGFDIDNVGNDDDQLLAGWL
jgi:type IV secretory pathway protease TraF